MYLAIFSLEYVTVPINLQPLHLFLAKSTSNGRAAREASPSAAASSVSHLISSGIFLPGSWFPGLLLCGGGESSPGALAPRAEAEPEDRTSAFAGNVFDSAVLGIHYLPGDVKPEAEPHAGMVLDLFDLVEALED
jgi:hypothetical protein